MYGFIFYILAALTRLGAKIILFGQDTYKRIEANNKGKETYIDHNGSSRLTSTGQRFTASQQPNGHWVWTDEKYDIIKDLSQESIERRRKENYEFAIKNGYSTYVWLTPQMGQRTQGAGRKIYNDEYSKYFKDNKIPYKLPILYKDIKSGDIYVVGNLYVGWKTLLEELTGTKINRREWMNMQYFVNPKTKEIIRPIDQKCFSKQAECLTQKEIDNINKFICDKNKNFITSYETLSIY